MKKSLGNKRNKIGDRDESKPDQIGDITQIHGNCQHGETRTFTADGNGPEKTLVVSAVTGKIDVRCGLC
jgi:type I restriction enzyme M protein